MAVGPSRLFLERAGIYSTFRAPAPTVAPDLSAIHDPTSFPWNDMPLPIPSLQFNGDPAPDRGLTIEPWPHGENV